MELVRGAARTRLFPARGHKPEDAYHVLARQLAAGEADLGLSLTEALTVLRWLHAAQRKFPSPLPIGDAAAYAQAAETIPSTWLPQKLAGESVRARLPAPAGLV